MSDGIVNRTEDGRDRHDDSRAPHRNEMDDTEDSGSKIATILNPSAAVFYPQVKGEDKDFCTFENENSRDVSEAEQKCFPSQMDCKNSVAEATAVVQSVAEPTAELNSVAQSTAEIKSADEWTAVMNILPSKDEELSNCG